MRKLFFRKSNAYNAAQNAMRDGLSMHIVSSDVEVFHEEDEEMAQHYPCCGTVNAYQIVDKDYNEIDMYGYWDEDDVETLSELADYINQSEEYPSDVDDIISRNGWNAGRTDEEIAWRKTDRGEEIAELGEHGVYVFERN